MVWDPAADTGRNSGHQDRLQARHNSFWLDNARLSQSSEDSVGGGHESAVLYWFLFEGPVLWLLGDWRGDDARDTQSLNTQQSAVGRSRLDKHDGTRMGLRGGPPGANG